MSRSKYAFGTKSAKGVTVTVRLAELNALVDQADKALDGDSNDVEHDALYAIRETLAEYSLDPNRRAHAD